MTPRLATVASPAPCGPVTAVASSAYAPEDASAASPTGKVIYAARFRDPASSGATYKAIPPPSTYTASPPKSPYEALVPQAAHKVLAAAMTLPTGGVTISPHLASTTLQTPHMANTASPMSRLFDAPAATSAIRRLPTDTSVRLAYHRHQDINHSLINMDDDNARYQGEHEEHEPFVRSEQILNHS
jgi:hypothetical protein